jgi:predicted Zn-dependent protease
VLLYLNQLEEAETALLTAFSAEPEKQDFFIALANYYLKTSQPDKARALAEETLRHSPDYRAATELLQYLDK